MAGTRNPGIFLRLIFALHMPSAQAFVPAPLTMALVNPEGFGAEESSTGRLIYPHEAERRGKGAYLCPDCGKSVFLK